MKSKVKVALKKNHESSKVAMSEKIENKTKQRTHTIKEALKAPSGTHLEILGWIATKSSIGGIKFALVRDGTGYIQIACKKDRVSSKSFVEFEKATKESAVWVAGSIREDKRAPGEKEISVTDFAILALSEKWPITKSAARASSSFLYDTRHLAIRGRKASSVLRVRAQLIYAAFDYFVKSGFTLISAPIIVQNAVEGGSTLFELNYFDKKAYLSQSAQLYEEAAIISLGKVFIFQPAFRAEKSKTNKHLTEFWMIEAEQAFAGQEENIRLQEALVKAMAERVQSECTVELKQLGRSFKTPEIPFPRMTYDEARDIASKKGLSYEWGDDIPTEAERIISKEFEVPFFITGYPLAARSFYHMTEVANEKVTRSADLIAPEGYGEIATGGQRIHDYAALMKRIASQDLPSESFSWYLDLRKYGMPEHSGFGLGVERTTRWFCGLKHIRAASLFPRTISRLKP